MFSSRRRICVLPSRVRTLDDWQYAPPAAFGGLWLERISEIAELVASRG